jgi:hypothetical protein
MFRGITANMVKLKVIRITAIDKRDALAHIVPVIIESS